MEQPASHEQFAQLCATHESVRPASYTLASATCTLGRDQSCQVVIEQNTVSRVHARISRDGPHYTLADAGSANGTYVNSRRISASHQLQHGDLIGLGQYPSLLQFVDPNSTMRPPEQLRYDDRFMLFFLQNQALDLTPAQHRLLLHLYRHAGEVCSRTNCAKALWGRDYDPDVDAGALDQAVASLRARLRQAAPDTEPIKARRGLGYQLTL